MLYIEQHENGPVESHGKASNELVVAGLFAPKVQ